VVRNDIQLKFHKNFLMEKFKKQDLLSRKSHKRAGLRSHSPTPSLRTFFCMCGGPHLVHAFLFPVIAYEKSSLWAVTYSWNYHRFINAMRCNVVVIFQYVNRNLILCYCPMVA
jgi:hypothetical protein